MSKRASRGASGSASRVAARPDIFLRRMRTQSTSAFWARPAWSASSSSRASRVIPGSVPPGWPPASDPKARPTRPSRRGGWRRRCPTPLARRIVEACVPGRGPRVVFSALDASVAGEIEQAFAAAGHVVVSNARNYRMDPLVPLLIPEVNADHLRLVAEQQRGKGWTGRHRHQSRTARRSCWRWRWRRCAASTSRRCIVSTMQAVSGAGYPGVPSLDILGNVVPFIGGEEEKIESETLKILGADGGRDAASARSSARTPTACRDRRSHHDRVGRARREARRSDDVVAALQAFRGRPQELGSAERAGSADRRDAREPIGRSRGSMPTAATAWPSPSAACARARCCTPSSSRSATTRSAAPPARRSSTPS